MVKKEIKKVNAEVITDVICNKCGQSLVLDRYFINNPVRLDHGEEGLQIYGLKEITVSGGYLSTHLDDATQYKFSLCEKCTKDLMDSFVIPAETKPEHF